MNSAHYKFVKTLGGRTYYAEVAVECFEITDGPVVRVAPSVTETQYDGWCAAAERGVWYALRHASPPPALPSLCVTVTTIRGLLVDTRDDTVAAAAAHATWEALGVGGSPPPRFEGRSIVFDP